MISKYKNFRVIFTIKITFSAFFPVVSISDVPDPIIDIFPTISEFPF